MEQMRFSKGLQPSTVEVAGCSVKLFFTFRAALAMEEHFQEPYLDTVLRMLQVPGDDGKPRSPMPLAEQAEIVAILMRNAGQEIDAADLMDLHMVDFSTLARAAQAEMLLKMPEGKKKRASRANGTGGASSLAHAASSPSRRSSFTTWLRSRCTPFWRRQAKRTSRR